MNTVTAQRGSEGLVCQGHNLILSEGDAAAVLASGAKEVIYGLRPEALRFADAGLPGTLRMLEPTGPETYAYVDSAIGPLVVRVPGLLNKAVGDRVWLSWATQDVHLFDVASEARIVAA